MNKKIFIIMFLISLIAMLAITVETYTSNPPKMSNLSYDNNDLSKLAFKYTQNITDIYNYTTEFYGENINMSYEEIKEKGGDCSEWSTYAVNWFRQYNVSAELNTICNENFCHGNALVYDMDEYCYIDAYTYKCWTLSD